MDALANVRVLTVSAVQELACFLYTLCFYAPFFHLRNVSSMRLAVMSAPNMTCEANLCPGVQGL